MEPQLTAFVICHLSFVISHFPFLQLEAESFRDDANSLPSVFRPGQPLVENS